MSTADSLDFMASHYLKSYLRSLAKGEGTHEYLPASFSASALAFKQAAFMCRGSDAVQSGESAKAWWDRETRDVEQKAEGETP
jgi:hypothetical protein